MIKLQIKDILEGAIKILKDNNIVDGRIIAKIILCFVLKVQKEYLIINEFKEVSKEIEEEYFSYINKIKSGIPLQYITNRQEFMKLDFYVDENVLIPRADTEILVEEVIQIVKSEKVKILDLCTGSGAIAVSLAKYIPTAKILASDVSEYALEVSKKNAKSNEVEVQCILSNLFDNIHESEIDIIVSNPPYIKEDVIEQLENNVKCEPYIALNGGKDGLNFYRKISKEAWKYLNKNGYLCLEIGYDQKDDVTNILENEGKYKNIYSKQDLAGNDRIIIARKG